MRFPKILLATPTSKYKDYCSDLFIKQVQSINYPVDVLIVDNSADYTYHNKFNQEGINVIHENPNGRSAREYMVACNEIIRNYAITDNYDYIFSLESDIFVDSDIIYKLLSHNKQVVGVSYFLFEFEKTVPMLLQHLSNETQLSISLPKIESSFLKYTGKLERVSGLGLGCVLIHRSVFSKIPFRVDMSRSGHADSFFYEDLILNNIPCYVDTSIMATHKNSDWGAVMDNQINQK